MSTTLATRALGLLAIGVCRHPVAFVLPQILLFAAGVGYTLLNLEFHTNRNALIDPDRQYHRNFLDYQQNFDSKDDIVVVVESEDSEKNRQFVERLGARLEKEPNLFSSVFYKGDLTLLGDKALLYLEDDSAIEEMQQRISASRSLIETFQRIDSLESLINEIKGRFLSAPDPSGTNASDLLDALPALQRVLTQANVSVIHRGVPGSPGIEMLFAAGSKAQKRKYLTFADGKIYLLTARAVSKESEKQAITRIKELVSQVQTEISGINVGVTGQNVLALDEMRQSQIDTLKASCISLILVMLIFSICYRELERPLKAVLCLLIGLGYTLGYTTLVVGHLNILTIAFLPILIGLAIDFGIHLLTRFEEELRRDTPRETAITKALVHTGRGIFTGCLTTAGAFYAMAFTDFKGIREMGLITGGGMLLTLVPMMTVYPVLLLHERSEIQKTPARPARRVRAVVERLWLHRPLRTLAAAVVLSLLAVSQLPSLRFDYNLLNMQSDDLPAVLFEKKLIREADKSVIFAVVIADSLEEAKALESEIRTLPSVSSVESMNRFFGQTNQIHRRQLIEKLKQTVADFKFPEGERRAVDLDGLSHSLSYFRSYLSMAIRKMEASNAADPRLPVINDIIATAENLQRNMRRLHPEVAKSQIANFERIFFEDIRRTFRTIANQRTDQDLSVDDLPASLRNRFIGKTGQHLLQVYPRENIWERTHQETFIAELRDLVGGRDKPPIVTGTPVQLFEYTGLLKSSYEKAALYALAVIALLTLFHFRSLSMVLLALLPVSIGSLWLTGTMSVMGIAFNPANIMTLPLVIGIGVTNGIHILNRYREENLTGLLSRSTGKGILVSGLTTIAGFGSLTLANHRGIESLGYVMTIGVFACMIAGLTVLPCLLQNLSDRRRHRLKNS